MPEEGKLVELVGVRKAFGDNVVLDGIDLAIGRGEAIVVAGPSGSGKSTMLRCVNGLEASTPARSASTASGSTPPGAGSPACAPTSGWSSSSSTCSRT